MKNFNPWNLLFITLFIAACGSKKAEIVEEQKRISKKIESAKASLGGAVYLQNEYISKSLGLDDIDKETEIKKDSLMRWSVYTNGLRKEIDSLQNIYDSLEMELKKY